MIITSSNKPLCVIGYADSTITQEAVFFGKRHWHEPITFISPEEFLALPDKNIYQYLVFFTLDTKLREQIIDIIEEEKLECFNYIDESAMVYFDYENMTAAEVFEYMGHGSIIAPFSTVMIHSKIGKHCIIETYCLLSHYAELGNNVILHSGVMIAGRTRIGKNSVFNFKASALNALTICDNVEVGAISCITKNVDKPGIYAGTLARYIGERVSFEETNV